MSIYGDAAFASKGRPAGTLAPAATVTLADVLFRLDEDEGLDQRLAREMRSAIHTVCRVIGADPGLVLAEPRQLRPRLAKLTPAMAGVSPGRWSNAKSLTLKALKRAGLKSMAGRSREPLASEWEALRALLPDRHFQSGLSRFMSYCTARGVDPSAITAETFVEFGREVRELQPRAGPRRRLSRYLQTLEPCRQNHFWMATMRGRST